MKITCCSFCKCNNLDGSYDLNRVGKKVIETKDTTGQYGRHGSRESGIDTPLILRNSFKRNRVLFTRSRLDLKKRMRLMFVKMENFPMILRK